MQISFANSLESIQIQTVVTDVIPEKKYLIEISADNKKEICYVTQHVKRYLQQFCPDQLQFSKL